MGSRELGPQDHSERGLMKIQFDDPLFEAWTQRFLYTMSEGGCEIGEIKATAARIPEGDRDAWYREWTATADRLFADAEACAAKNARVSARYLYLRATTYYRLSYPLLYSRPTDPRVKSRCAASSRSNSEMWWSPQVSGVNVPVESTTPMVPLTLQSFRPALVPAGGAASERSNRDPSANRAKIVTPVEST